MHRSNYECYPNPDGTRGWVWNPITGSLGDCPNPNARKLANGRLKSRYLANKKVVPYKDERDYMDNRHNPFHPRFWEKRLSALTPFQKPRGIFVCDMGELFGGWLPERWQEWVFGKIRECRQHRFYLLTKQPQNLIKFSPFPDNCWVGVTATDAKMARNALHELLRIEAKVKYISFEPLLERIYIDCAVGVDWVIIGAQTKPYKPPQIEWVEEIVRACDKAGVPVFLKDNLKPLFNFTGVMKGLELGLTLLGDGSWGLRQELP